MDLFQEILTTRKSDSSPQDRMKSAVLATAIVRENWNQELPGYVKVEYVLGEEGERSSEWIRVLHGYAGNGFGDYALPEIGSEVLVGFIMGDLTHAIVLGCLHNSENKLPDQVADENNTVKQFKTKGGHEIKCYGEEGKEKIQIKTPGNISITMDDENNNIEIKEDSGDNVVVINGKDGAVSIKAGKKMELTCGGAKIVLDGNASKLEISADQLQISGNQSLKLSGQSFGAEGTSMELKAKGSLKIESSGVAQVKGAMLKLN